MAQGFFSIRQRCPHCGGTGELVDTPCKQCRGEGLVQKWKKIQIHIPAGVRSGSRLRVSGEGEAGRRGGPPGDLYVVLHVKDHDVFERQDDDLFCEIPVPIDTATLGGTIRVPTIGGAAELRIPAGTQNGTVFRLRGKGVPSLQGYGRGDQHVRIFVEVPTGLSSAQKKKLQEFSDISDPKTYPRLRAFIKKANEFFS